MIMSNISGEVLTEKNQLVGSLVSGTIQQKLQKRLLDLIDKSVEGKSDSHLLEYLEMAKSYGFDNEASVIERLVFEFGERAIKSAREKKNNKRELDQKERRLEDYLAAGENLSKVEPGLRYVGRQQRIQSGRKDIDALQERDKSEVTVELKYNGYDEGDVAVQLMKYLNEEDKKKAIFIAPKVNPALFFSLKHFIDSGRLSLYEVQEIGQDFSFRSVHREDFGEGEIKSAAGKKKKTSKKFIGDEISVVKVFRNNKVRDEIYDKVCKDIFRRYPFFRNDLALNIKLNPRLVGTLSSLLDEDYHSSRKADSWVDHLERLSGLKSNELLISPSPEDSPLRGLQSLADIDEHYLENIKLYSKLFNKRDYISLLETIKHVGDFHSHYRSTIITGIMKNSLGIFPEDPNCSDVSKILGTLKKDRKLLDDMLLAYKKDNYYSLKKGVDLLRNAEKTNPHFANKVYLGALSFAYEKFFSETLGLKIARAQAIQEVNDKLALRYLLSSVGKDNYHFIVNSPAIDLTLDCGTLLYEAQMDGEAYKEIYSRLGIEEIPIDSSSRMPLVGHQSSLSEIPKALEYVSLRDSIVNGHSSDLSSDVSARISHLIDDSQRYETDEAKLSGAFSKFNLGRRIRNREERPSDIKIRNFFDDITTRYFIKGKIPNEDDLEKLYMEDCS